jgi:hypothetical protein
MDACIMRRERGGAPRVAAERRAQRFEIAAMSLFRTSPEEVVPPSAAQGAMDILLTMHDDLITMRDRFVMHSVNVDHMMFYKETIQKAVARAKALRPQVKSLLNKITAENFTSITDKLANLDLTPCELTGMPSTWELDIVIGLVFDKAVSEHHYCDMYADMCLVLRTRFPELQAPERTPGANAFTRALLNRCQKEFENLPQTLDPFAMTEEQTKLTPEEQEVITKKMKDRALGNMKFIGHLYLRKLLSHKVVRLVVLRLLFENESPEEHYIECVCMLLRNIGATLESSDQGRSYMQQFASRMKDLSQVDLYSRRIKFAIQNVLDLRSSGWQERVLRERMQTRDQLRRDAMREQRAQQMGVQDYFARTEIAGQRPQYITAAMQQRQQQGQQAAAR